MESSLKGIIRDGKEEGGEWVDTINENQSTFSPLIRLSFLMLKVLSDQIPCLNKAGATSGTLLRDSINWDNLLRFWFEPTYRPNNLWVPNPSIEPDIFIAEDCSVVDRNELVFPVYRSPKINCLCPLPTGNILSTTLNPVSIACVVIAKQWLGIR